MKNNYLVIPNSKEDANELKSSKLLLPLKFFSVGFNYYFSLEEINYEKAYLYINRLLSSNELDELKKVLSNLPKNIKGIVFEDLGIYEITKNINIEKIFYPTHLLTNVHSINEYLKYFDSCVISPDIHINKVNHILKNANKKLCIFGYGHMPLSYSRRLLNTNYAKIYNLKKENTLYIKNTDYEFITSENQYGTITYDKGIFSGLNETYEDNILYIIINLFDIEVKDFLENKLDTTKGFLDKEVIYKIKKENIND